MKHYRIIVLDFDGTLYDSDTHFDAYVRRIQTHLPVAAGQELEAAFARSRRGEGSVRVGYWYDPVTGSSESDGGRLSHGFYMGDHWWILYMLALSHGATPEQLTDSFYQTRAHMMSHTQEIHLVDGMKDFLTAVHKNEQTQAVLVTNSPAADSLAILEALEVRDLFAEIVTDAKKPDGLRHLLPRLMTAACVSPGEILSVGDHYFNDIVPALEFGSDALFVNRHGVNHKRHATYEATSSDGFIGLLNQIPLD